MLPVPTCFSLVAGASEGEQPLTAFDAALLVARVGDLNLLKVSSILPPRCRHVAVPNIAPGSLVPIAYGCQCSSEPGVRVAASVAVGLGQPDEPGVIMEHSMLGTREEAERLVVDKVREAFRNRGRGEPTQVMVRGIDHVVQAHGCAFAGVVLSYDTRSG